MKSTGRLLGKYGDRSGIYWYFCLCLGCKVIFSHEKAYIAGLRPLPRLPLPYTHSILVIFLCVFGLWAAHRGFRLQQTSIQIASSDALNNIANAFILRSDYVKLMES